jgi:hypothetical protein
MIERSVYSEYQTFLKNRDATNVKYAHSDSANVYHFIEEILAQPRNNPVQPFDKYSEIEEWLRDQWAGLFRELMLRLSSQQQIATLANQVSELAEVNKTLRRYLEEVIAKVSPQESARIIEAESERLADATVESKLKSNRYVRLLERNGIPFEVIRQGLEDATTLKDFKEIIRAHPSVPEDAKGNILLPAAREDSRPFQDFNEARKTLGLPAFTPVKMKGLVETETTQ